MYARTAFRFENNTTLCPFLSELDCEESIAQEKEEAEIKAEITHQSRAIRALVGGSMLGVLAGTIGMVISAIFSNGTSKAVLSVIIAGIVSGVVAGLGLGKYIYDHDFFTKDDAVNKLKISRFRAIRLDDKVDRITKKLLKKDLPLNEEQQSWKARSFFQETLAKYRNVGAFGSKGALLTYGEQGTRGDEGSPALQRRQEESRLIQLNDMGVQTELGNEGSSAVLSEQGKMQRVQQDELYSKDGVECPTPSEFAVEDCNVAEVEMVQTFVEGSEKGLGAAMPFDKSAKKIPEETRLELVVNDNRAVAAVEKKEVLEEPLLQEALVLTQPEIADSMTQAKSVEFQQQQEKEYAEQPAGEDQDEVSSDRQHELMIAQIDELEKRSRKFGQRLRDLLKKKDFKWEFLQDILDLANPNGMSERFVQVTDSGFRNKNAKARTLVNRLACIGSPCKLVGRLRDKIEQGYDIFYDKNKRVFNDVEKTKLSNFHALFLILSHCPVGVEHSDLNFGANFAQVMKGLTEYDRETLIEIIDFRWSRDHIPIHIELLKRALQA